MHLPTKKKIIWLILISFIIVSSLIAVAIKCISDRKNKNDPNIVTEKIVMDHRYNFKLVHAKEPEKGLLIYISDANSPAVTADYSQKFAELSYYVANIDSQTLLNSLKNTDNQCVHLAEALKTISKQLQDSYKIDSDELPVLVGDNEGATLVYAALVQTDKHYFHAGVSINFAPHLDSKVPLCSLNNIDNSQIAINTMSPAKHLSTNWYVFQSALNAKNTDSNNFITHIGNAKLTLAENNAAPNTAKGDPITEAIQILQWLDPRLDDQITSDNNDSNLPLIEVPAETNSQNIMAVLVTGDGGWAEIDKNVAAILAEKGIPTVALDSLSYFWRARTQEETARDIDDVISQYREKWQKQKVILIGYSFGADALPFIANNLSEESKTDLALVALLGMGKTAAFEFHLSSWMDADTSSNRLPTLPELDTMRWANSICIYGVDDEETACPQTANLGVKVISMNGDHHFNEEYNVLVQHIIENIK